MAGTESGEKAAAIRRHIRELLGDGTLPCYPGSVPPSNTADWPLGATPPNFTTISPLMAPCLGCGGSDGYGSKYPVSSGPVWFHQGCADIWKEESERVRPGH